MSAVPEPFTTGALQRRAPFGDQPEVGARGLRTQERILEAALGVFDEVGYDECTVELITARANCSRPSFYQYFATKEELFRRLSGDLAHRIFEVCAAPDPITADVDGLLATRTLVAAYGDLYDRFSPLYSVFCAAAISDEVVANAVLRVSERQVRELLRRFDLRRFRSRRANEVTAILVSTVLQAERLRALLAMGQTVNVDRARLEAAVADVVHRALYGSLPGVNVRERCSTPKAGATEDMRPLAHPDDDPGAGTPTRARLVAAARDVFASRGYHHARVEDILRHAGAARATFYRYFPNKQVLFRIVAAESSHRLVTATETLRRAIGSSNAGSTANLRRIVRDYVDVYNAERPITMARTGAEARDDELEAESVHSTTVQHRTFVELFADREFGDPEAEALVLMALLDLRDPALDPSAMDGRVLLDALTLVMQRGVLLASPY